MPGALGEAAAGLIGNVIYVVGESIKGDDPGPTYAYDMASKIWTGELPTRELRGDHHGAEVLNGQFYLFGGLDFDGVQTAVQIYDPLDLTWRFGADMPFRTGSQSTATIGDWVYMCGGIDETLRDGRGDTVPTCAR